MAGIFTFTSPSTLPNAGISSQYFTFTPSDTINYAIATGLINVKVNKAAPAVITPPTASAIIYGQKLSSSILSGGVASVAGTFAFTASSTAPSAGVASRGFTFTPTNTLNYNTTTGTVSVTVNKATPTIKTSPTASTIIYGQSLSSSILKGVGSVVGTFKFTSPSTMPNAGTVFQGFTFTPTDAIDYTTITGTVQIKVSKAVPTVTALPTAVAIIYGQTLAACTLSGGVGSVAGTFAFTSPNTVPKVGTALQSFTYTPNDTTNYTTAVGKVNVKVNKAG